jgi:hypothetical protein
VSGSLAFLLPSLCWKVERMGRVSGSTRRLTACLFATQQRRRRQDGCCPHRAYQASVSRFLCICVVPRTDASHSPTMQSWSRTRVRCSSRAVSLPLTRVSPTALLAPTPTRDSFPVRLPHHLLPADSTHPLPVHSLAWKHRQRHPLLPYPGPQLRVQGLLQVVVLVHPGQGRLRPLDGW